MAKDFQSQTVVDGYDQHIRKLIPGYELVHLQIQAILKTHLPEHAHVLIVGCGTGYELSYLLAQHPTWSFTAVDPSLTMIEKAQQLLSETHRDLTRVHFVHGDTTTALQASAQFDAALAILVAHFIPLEAKPFFFADILRCLKTQAILLSYDLMRSSDDTELKVLQTLCQSNGLTVVQSEKMIERLQQDFYLVSANQMRELLTKVGFHEVRTYSQLLNYYGFFAQK